MTAYPSVRKPALEAPEPVELEFARDRPKRCFEANNRTAAVLRQQPMDIGQPRRCESQCFMTPTDRQTAILRWLAKAYPHAGRMFESALSVAETNDIPCRARMIAHAYREICSELMNRYSPNSRDELKPLLDDLADQFQSLARRAAAGPASTPPIESDPASVAVPQTFIDSAQRVVTVHLAAPKGMDRSLAVFRGMAQRAGAAAAEVIPTAERWFRMSKFFVARAHDRKADDGPLLLGDEFKGEAEFFEATLQSFAAQLANAFGMITCAEGVETKQQLEMLKTLGCQQAQGYLISRPVPIDDIERLVQASSDDKRTSRAIGVQ
jgi:hypothetical protein